MWMVGASLSEPSAISPFSSWNRRAERGCDRQLAAGHPFPGRLELGGLGRGESPEACRVDRGEVQCAVLDHHVGEAERLHGRDVAESLDPLDQGLAQGRLVEDQDVRLKHCALHRPRWVDGEVGVDGCARLGCVAAARPALRLPARSVRGRVAGGGRSLGARRGAVARGLLVVVAACDRGQHHRRRKHTQNRRPSHVPRLGGSGNLRCPSSRMPGQIPRGLRSWAALEVVLDQM